VADVKTLIDCLAKPNIALRMLAAMSGGEAPTPLIEELYNQHISGPKPNQISSKSFEEIVQDMSKTPLFMNSLDEATDEGTPNSMATRANG